MNSKCELFAVNARRSQWSPGAMLAYKFGGRTSLNEREDNPAWLADPCQYPSLNRSSSITPEPRATPTNPVTYPAYSPSLRRIKYGDWNVKRGKPGRSNQSVTLALPTTAIKNDVILELTYENRKDDVARDLMNHYFACAGEWDNFKLPKDSIKKGVMAGWKVRDADSYITKGRWSYARPPQVESTHVGRSTTKITLVSIGTDVPVCPPNSFPGDGSPSSGPDGGRPAPSPGPGKPIPAPEPVPIAPGWPTPEDVDPELWPPDGFPTPEDVPPIFPSVTIPLKDIPISEDYTTLQAYVDIESVRYSVTKGYTRCGSTSSSRPPIYNFSKSLERNVSITFLTDYLKWEHPSVDRDIVSSDIVVDMWTSNCSAGSYIETACGESGGTYDQRTNLSCNAERGDFVENYLCRRGVLRIGYDVDLGRKNIGNLVPNGRRCDTDGMWGGNRLGGWSDYDGIWAHFNAITKITIRWTKPGIPDYIPFDQSDQWPI